MSDPLSALDALDPESLDLSPRPRAAALEFLLTRRSTPAKTLVAPGPDDAALERMLRAAIRTPDHKKLAPWRFIVIGPETRQRLDAGIESRGAALGLEGEAIEKARRAAKDAPCVIAVVFSPRLPSDVPEIEQLLSTGAAAAGLLNAALASGFGANWLTGWHAHDSELMQSVLGLSAQEKIAGFIHIGMARVAPPERPRPPLSECVQRLP